MAPKIQHKRSAVAGKAPQPADLDYGEIGVNYEATDPALYIKDSADAIRKIGNQPDASETVKGIVELATAAETTTGTDATRAVHPAGLKVELDKKANQATTYTKTETDAALALKADLASPALTGTPTAPTAAAGTNTTQVATTEFVTAAVAVENLWDRTGTVVSPTTAGDDVFTTGAVKVGGTSAAPNIQVKADGSIVANTDGLVYDATNKRLGLGSSLPQALFHLEQPSSASVQEHLRIVGGNRSDNSYATGLRISTGTASANSNRHQRIICDSSFTIQGYETSTGNVATDTKILLCPSGGNVGIGSIAPSTQLYVFNSSTAQGIEFDTQYGFTSAGFPTIRGYNRGAKTYQNLGLSGASVVFGINDEEKARLDASGRLLVGTSTAVTGSAALLQASTTANLAAVATYADNTAAKAGGLVAGDVYRKADGTLMITF